MVSNIDDLVEASLDEMEKQADELNDGDMLYDALLSHLADRMIDDENQFDLMKQFSDYVSDASKRIEQQLNPKMFQKHLREIHIRALTHHIKELLDRGSVEDTDLKDIINEIVNENGGNPKTWVGP
jgi:hypothetical protein